MGAMREIQSGGIHAALNQSMYDGRRTTRWPDGADDFGLSHAHVEAPPRFHPKERKRISQIYSSDTPGQGLIEGSGRLESCISFSFVYQPVQ
jgi:hypothetical protein